MNKYYKHHLKTMELSSNPTLAIIHSRELKFFSSFVGCTSWMPRAISIPTCRHYYACIFLFIRIFGLFSVKTDRVCVPLKLPPNAALPVLTHFSNHFINRLVIMFTLRKYFGYAGLSNGDCDCDWDRKNPVFRLNKTADKGDQVTWYISRANIYGDSLYFKY